MRGYAAHSLPDLVARHHRHWGSADGRLRGRARHGECAWILHQSPPWALLRSLKLAASRPCRSLRDAFFYGYARAAARERRASTTRGSAALYARAARADARAAGRRAAARAVSHERHPEPPEAPDLREAAVHGVRWAAMVRGTAEVVLMASMILLARLISPAEFGYFAVAIIAQELAIVITAEGIGTALVQRETVDREHLQAGLGSPSSSGSCSWCSRSWRPA